MIEIKAVAPFGIRVRFNDGAAGTHDCATIPDDPGPMALPLKDPDYFARVFLESGAPTWPNGYDMCPDWLRQEMQAAGELRAASANATE